MRERHATRPMRRIVDQLGFRGIPLPRIGRALYLQRPPLYPLMRVEKIGIGLYEIDYRCPDGSKEQIA